MYVRVSGGALLLATSSVRTGCLASNLKVKMRAIAPRPVGSAAGSCAWTRPRMFSSVCSSPVHFGRLLRPYAAAPSTDVTQGMRAFHVELEWRLIVLCWRAPQSYRKARSRTTNSASALRACCAILQPSHMACVCPSERAILFCSWRGLGLAMITRPFVHEAPSAPRQNPPAQ